MAWAISPLAWHVSSGSNDCGPPPRSTTVPQLRIERLAHATSPHPRSTTVAQLLIERLAHATSPPPRSTTVPQLRIERLAHATSPVAANLIALVHGGFFVPRNGSEVRLCVLGAPRLWCSVHDVGLHDYGEEPTHEWNRRVSVHYALCEPRVVARVPHGEAPAALQQGESVMQPLAYHLMRMIQRWGSVLLRLAPLQTPQRRCALQGQACSPLFPGHD